MMHANRKSRKRNGSGRSGFTLVETMVSSMVLSVAVIAMSAVLRKGQEIALSAAHYQKARAIADSCLESRIYGCENYDGMNADTSQVVIDDRYGAPLAGELTISVSEERNIVGDEFVPVFFKEIGARVTWREPEGEELFVISKRVTRL